ncbi:MAG: hypothetical protein AB7O38_03725 [Pirellulaceae bacterium]
MDHDELSLNEIEARLLRDGKRTPSMPPTAETVQCLLREFQRRRTRRRRQQGAALAAVVFTVAMGLALHTTRIAFLPLPALVAIENRGEVFPRGRQDLEVGSPVASALRGAGEPAGSVPVPMTIAAKQLETAEPFATWVLARQPDGTEVLVPVIYVPARREIVRLSELSRSEEWAIRAVLGLEDHQLAERESAL